MSIEGRKVAHDAPAQPGHDHNNRSLAGSDSRRELGVFSWRIAMVLRREEKGSRVVGKLDASHDSDGLSISATSPPSRVIHR
jgi:hypothetical protein